MSSTKITGTCPACFRAIALTSAGIVGRHGWVEGGGRQVGVHGRAWHSGACFGAGWKPFEVSPDGTTAFLREVLFPFALGAITALETLSMLPALFVDEQKSAYETSPHGIGRWAYFPFVVRLRAGEPGYVNEHARRVSARTSDLEAAMVDGPKLLERVRTWKPAPTTVVVKKAPIVHGLNPDPKYVRFSACGRRLSALRGGALLRTGMDPDVTCPKCRERITARAAAPAK